MCNGLHPPLPGNGPCHRAGHYPAPSTPCINLSCEETDLIQHLDMEWWHSVCHWGVRVHPNMLCCYLLLASHCPCPLSPSLFCACHKVLIELPHPALPLRSWSICHEKTKSRDFNNLWTLDIGNKRWCPPTRNVPTFRSAGSSVNF